MTNKSTREQAMWFIRRNQPGFPNARIDRRFLDRIGNDGVPAALAVLDGEVVWMGHPQNVSRRFLDGLVGGE